jgi:hypothetical protein
MAESYIGVERRNFEWVSTIRVDNKIVTIGSFPSAVAAALARDMELLRRYGEEAPDLNFQYEIISCDEKELVLSDSRKVKITVERDSREGAELTGPTPLKLSQGRESVNAPMLCPDSFANLIAANTMPWPERTQSAFSISTAFSYEISFPHQNSLGLNLKPLSLTYPLGSGSRTIGCLTIVDATPFLASVIMPGDILVRINSTELALPGHLFDFEKATKAITSAEPPRVLRFIRPSGPGIAPSIAETTAMLHESSPTARFQVVLNGNGALQTLQLVHIDPQVPLSIRKQMQGQKMQWDFYPIPVPGLPASVRKFPARSAPGGKPVDAHAAEGAQRYLVFGSLCRDRTYTSSYAISGTQTATGGQGSLTTAVIPGVQGCPGVENLLCSGAPMVTWGKWIVYITVETILSSGSAAEDSVRSASSVLGEAAKKGPVRRYFVGKFSTEEEAKMQMNRV